MVQVETDRRADPDAPEAGVPALLQRAADEARRLLDADGATVHLLGDDRRTLRWAHDAGVAAGPERQSLRSLEVRVGEGIFGHAVAQRRILMTGDYSGDTSFPHAPGADAFVAATGIRSVVVAPLVTGDDEFGALGVYSRRADAFGEHHVALIRALAEHAAAAIANARLIQQLSRSERELERRLEALRTLRGIAARITALRDGETILQLVVDESKRLLCSDGAHLTLMAEDGDYLVPTVVARDGAEDAVNAEWLHGMQFPLDGGINGLAASLGKPVWTPDYLVDPRIPHEPEDQETAQQLGLRAMASAPLRAPEGGIIGTLAVSYREPRAAVADDEIELLQGLADQAAIVVTNIRLYEQLSESERRYRYLLEHSPDVVYETDADGRCTFVSEASERVIGWRPDELLGQHFSTVVYPEALDEVTRSWADLVAGSSTEGRYRFRLMHRDGHAVLVEMSSVARWTDGRFAGTHGSLRDVSERERLERDLRRQAAEIAAGEERALLARELHDSVTQALFSMTLTARSLELLLERDPAGAREKLGELQELQRDALAEMRALIFELRPGSLEQEGLVPALRKHVAAVQGRTGLSMLLDLDPIERLPPATEGALYRIAQEALHNVVKHAGAREVRIALQRRPHAIRLSVEDDGSGFDAAQVTGTQLGLAGMRTRAERAGGRLDVSSRPGEGTHVEAVVPVDAVGGGDGSPP